MHIPVILNQCGGEFIASVPWLPGCEAKASEREVALGMLQTQLHQLIEQDKLTFIDVSVGRRGPHAFAGIFKDDPFLDEIREEAYRLRDEERRREFGE